jgi:hypothetical protein
MPTKLISKRKQDKTKIITIELICRSKLIYVYNARRVSYNVLYRVNTAIICRMFV